MIFSNNWEWKSSQSQTKKNEKQKSENQKQSTDRKLLENNSISVSSNRKNKSCRIQKKFLEWKKYPVEMAGEIYFNFLFP